MNTVSDPIEQLENPLNITKYKDAGKITALVLDTMIKQCVPGTTITQLCQRGDSLIKEEVDKIQAYSTLFHKGVCFPTCITVNEFVGNCCEGDYSIKEGDVVKIECGVHIDGFPARVCTTVFVGETMDKETGRLFQALSDAGRTVVQLLTDKNANIDVSRTLKEISEKYDCSVLTVRDGITAPGTVSYQVSRNVIDGRNEDDDEFVHQLIIHRNHPESEITMRRQPFFDKEVYCIDIAFSIKPGTGLITKTDKCGIFKRNRDRRETLKLKASTGALNSFRNRFPINTTTISDTRFKFGLKECLSKGLVEEYAVYKDKGIVGRSMFTVIVGAEPILVTGRSLESELKKIEI